MEAAPSSNAHLYAPAPVAATAGYATSGGYPGVAVAAQQIQVNVNPPAPVPQKEPFAIKVMRLPSPSFHTTPAVPWRLDSHLSSSPAAPISPAFALSPLLLLPTNIGTVYLGETFRACVSVWSQCSPSAALQGVGIKLELQTSSRRWTLADSTQSPANMQGGSTRDLLVQHNLAELGVNCLVCLVSYIDPESESGERRSFQKFFKFHVHDPFAIHTTIHAREGQGLLLAEVALTSLVQRAVHLARVSFEPADPRIRVEDLNGLATDDDTPPSDDSRARSGSSSDASNGPSTLLCGSASRVFLFRLHVPPTYTEALLGRLQLRWRSLAGENGRIKSSGISRSAARGGGGSASLGLAAITSPIECTLLAAPATAPLETPFVVRALVRNTSTTQPMLAVLQLVKERMGTLLPLGPATRQLGLIGPGASLEVDLQLLGVGLGVQRVAGVRLSLHPATSHAVPISGAQAVTQDFDHLHQLQIIAQE